MRLCELVEALSVNADQLSTIREIIVDWSKYLKTRKSEIYDDMSDEEFDDIVYDLQRIATPRLVSLIQPFFRQKNITDVTGPMIMVRIVNDPSVGNEASASSWARMPLYPDKLTAMLTLKMPPTDMLDLAKGYPGVIDDLTSLISHEMLHLMQAMKSNLLKSTHRTLARDVADEYLGEPIEIDAYAQSVVSNILLQSRYRRDPTEYLISVVDALRTGNNSKLTAYFPWYTGFKRKVGGQRIWKRFNKKVYDKLMQHINNT